MGTCRSRTEYYYDMLWAGLGVHLSFGAGQSIAEVLGCQSEAKVLPKGLEDFHWGWRTIIVVRAGVLKWGAE